MPLSPLHPMPPTPEERAAFDALRWRAILATEAARRIARSTDATAQRHIESGCDDCLPGLDCAELRMLERACRAAWKQVDWTEGRERMVRSVAL